ncbi:MAG TPA: LamG domain-containing protein [Kofleriaceae bacterium]|nr:LamG domain-containing protein [Kofleriaceae bacterium]
MKRRLLSLVVVVGSALTAAIAACGNARSAAPDAGPDAPPAVDLDRGCIYRAKLDETAWGATGKPVGDACGNDLGAITGSAATPVNDATRGRVGAFSGSACIDIANSSALHATTQLTMSAWIRPTALNGVDSNGIISKRTDRGDASEEYGLFTWTGNHVWIDLGEIDRFQGAAVLTNNVWTHVAAVYDAALPDADRVKLYINGVRDPLTHVNIGNLSQLPTHDAPLHLGCTPAPKSTTPPTLQTFQGNLDDIRIWNRALTVDELLALTKT